MKWSCSPLVGVMVIASSTGAQQLTGNATADSAAVARASYRRAVQAIDPAVATREIGRAATAWPTQPAYEWASALMAARTLDTAAALNALEAFASLSLGRDLAVVPDFAFMARLPRFQQVRKRHDANRSPIAASRVVHEVDDSEFWPEGVDFDPATRVYFVAGVRRGTIMRIDAAGRSMTFWSGDSARRSAVLGVRVDSRRRVVWATTSGIRERLGFLPADSGNASLIAIGIEDGQIKAQWHLAPAAGGHVLGDLGVGPEGDVFFTDSKHPVLYRIRPGTDSIHATTHPLFYSLQGVAPTPDGRAVYVADYSHGLLRIDLATNAVERLSDAPHSTSLGCDGLTLRGDSLICVQNGVWPARVSRFRLDESGRAIVRQEVIDRNFAIADEPTIGTMAGDEFVYVATSQWGKRDESGKPLPGAKLRGLVLLGVKIE
jgi:sugar lactone lactonase YvrE